MSDSTDTNSPSESRRKVGDILRDERILRDEDLKDVAKALAIRLPFMEAIENSEPQNLPGAAYALGFVRSYADYLGLDSKALVEQYKNEAKELERQIALNFPEPLPSRGVPVVALLFIGTVLAVLFYGAWWYLNNQGKEISDYVPALSEEQTEIVESVEAPVTETTETSTVTETVEDTVEEIAETAVDTTAEAVQEVAEEAVDTVTETIEEVVTEVTETVEEVSEEVTETTTQAVETVETTVEAVVETPVEEATETVTQTNETSVTETVETISNEEIVNTDNNETLEATTEAVETAIEEVATTSTATETEAVVEEVVETAVTEETVETVTEEQPTQPISSTTEREPRIYGEENSGSRVTLMALDSAWVEVIKPGGELTLTRLLRKGDRYLVPNESGLTMVTGNAGGVMVIVDGKELGASGPIGAVRRDYLLDADHLLNNGVDQQ